MVTIGYTPGLAYSTSPTDSYGFAPAHMTSMAYRVSLFLVAAKIRPLLTQPVRMP